MKSGRSDPTGGTPMMLNQLPADELANVQEKIRALRAREVALRRCFTDDSDDGLYEGCEFDVEVRMQKRCVLNQNLLPAEILNDPKYFDIRYAPTVRVKPRVEPRLPLDFGRTNLGDLGDNFEVIER